MTAFTSYSLGRSQHGNTAAFLLASIGVCSASLVATVTSSPVSFVLTSLAMALMFVSASRVSAIRLLSYKARLVVILLVLRPTVDVFDSHSFSLLGFSLQDIYAVCFAAALLIFWLRADYSYKLTTIPNALLLALLALSTISLFTGGIAAGMNSFIRTVWGLVVALLLGPVFQTEHEIDTLIRAVFYSSIALVLFLPFNLSRGEYFGTVWRVGGQYDVPNTLAAVAFSFFAYGLYVIAGARTHWAKLGCILLLGTLAWAIALTQSRTVALLMIAAVAAWLWTMKQNKTLVAFVLILVCLIFLSSATSNWRVLSSWDIRTGEASDDLLNLSGRDFLWGQTLLAYMDANLLHKVIGLGWGAVHENFASLKLDLSSVTENSFLWFLAGAGAIGLLLLAAYLLWTLFHALAARRHAASEFDRRLAALGFVVVLTFIAEGFTTDLVLSPVASGYLYAILSICVTHWLRARLVNKTRDLAQIPK